MARTESPEGFADLSDLVIDDDTESDGHRRRRRGFIALGVVLLVIGLIAGAIGTYVHLALSATAAEATVTATAPVIPAGAPASYAMPSVGASAVSVSGAEQFAGTAGVDGILASSGSADAAPIASISKLITALVILDAKPLAVNETGPTITFTEADSDLYDLYYVRGATIQPMKAGSRLTERQALELMLVGSASNYAEATSTWAFGSQANFLRAANRWLDANGLVNTTLVEPTGLDARNRSTPTELIALGRIALANPVVAQIAGMPTITIPDVGWITNNNTLLGTAGVTGLKTGTLEASGSCLLFSAILTDLGLPAPLRVVGVVLGGDDRDSANASVVTMLDSIGRSVHHLDLTRRDEVVGTVTTPWGDTANIVAAQDAKITTFSDTPVTVAMDTARVTTGSKGDEVGSLTFTAEGETQTVALVLDAPIAGPDEWWRITHPEEMLGW